jgi:formylglycine-generating enzyme required for sulfatase activity
MNISPAGRSPIGCLILLLGLAVTFPSIAASNEPEVFVNEQGIRFVRIPAGSFLMGTPDPPCPEDDPATPVNERERCLEAVNPDERPARTVIISRAFYMGQYEVTQDQWERVMDTNPSGFHRDAAAEEKARVPVENVSWEDIQLFLARLNALDGKSTYRLPTEAEWEYACRAGTTGDFYGRPRNSIMWYDRNSGHVTRAVGTARPNAWGLYDMLGNVWEWCRDWYDKDYYRNGPAIDPQGPATGTRRVLRGGGIYDWLEQCRVSFRCSGRPDDRCDSVGFRLVRAARVDTD